MRLPQPSSLFPVDCINNSLSTVSINKILAATSPTFSSPLCSSSVFSWPAQSCPEDSAACDINLQRPHWGEEGPGYRHTLHGAQIYSYYNVYHSEYKCFIIHDVMKVHFQIPVHCWFIACPNLVHKCSKKTGMLVWYTFIYAENSSIGIIASKALQVKVVFFLPHGHSVLTKNWISKFWKSIVNGQFEAIFCQLKMKSKKKILVSHNKRCKVIIMRYTVS